MDLMDISKKRMSVRKYSSIKVEKEKLDKILEAGRWAPTAVNAQPQRIIVLDTEENLQNVRKFSTFDYDKKYIDLAKECEDKDNHKNNYYYGAPVVLLVCYDKNVCWRHPNSGARSGETDAVIVATHMMLEAASLDLGTVWISYFDTEKAKEMLNLPEEIVPVCMLYVGYPAEDVKPSPNPKSRRYPIEKTVFYNKYEII